MKKPEELFENAIEHWRVAGGKGTALVPSNLNDKILLLGILVRIYNRSPTTETLIIVKDFNTRNSLIEFLTTREDSENNAEFKKLIESSLIKIYTENFSTKVSYKTSPTLTIVYHIDDPENRTMNYLENSRFSLVVINKLIEEINIRLRIYKSNPLLDDFKQVEIDELRTSTPVEEYQIPIIIPEDSEDYKLLNYYNEYITTSINIFGSFDLIQQARTGNQDLNISSTQICNKIASENGWNPHLDMNVGINQEIDKLYNPLNLGDRATKTYEVIRERAKLLTDYKGKLSEIFKIVEEHPNEKILIISKRGEFANTITEYINTYSMKDICGNYHDKIEDAPAIDVEGYPIYVKSGSKKGERRIYGFQAQKTLNEKRFNLNKIRVLSTNNAPDKNLAIHADIIIMTSSLCEDMKSYLYRLQNVSFNSSIPLYIIYCKNSLEEKQMERRYRQESHKIVNQSENNVNLDENFGIILVD